MCDKLILSPLGHTWFLDLDGTIVKHNGYLIDGYDTLLNGVKTFLDSIPEGDKIIFLTSREEKYRDVTESFLKQNSIRYDEIIYGLPFGERILLNDSKPSGLHTSIAVDKDRDSERFPAIEIDHTL